MQEQQQMVQELQHKVQLLEEQNKMLTQLLNKRIKKNAKWITIIAQQLLQNMFL